MLNSWKTDFFHTRKGKFMREIVHFSGHELFVLPDFHKLNSVSVEFLKSYQTKTLIGISNWYLSRVCSQISPVFPYIRGYSFLLQIFIEHLLYPGTILGTGDSAVYKTGKNPCRLESIFLNSVYLEHNEFEVIVGHYGPLCVI